MELDVVAISAALFTAVGVGAKSLWDRIWSMRDRKAERDAVRDEAHRKDLAHALVEFTTATNKMIDAGFLMANLLTLQDDLRRRVQVAAAQAIYGDEQKAEHQRLLGNLKDGDQRVRDSVQAWAAAATTACEKGTNALMLDENHARGVDVWNLSREPIAAPSSIEDCNRFRKELRERRSRLDQLIVKLGGEFAPRRWDARANVTSGPSSQIAVVQQSQIGAPQESQITAEQTSRPPVKPGE